MGFFARWLGKEPRRVLMIPASLGGEDHNRNVTWLYAGTIREKRRFEATVLQMIREGLTVDYRISLVYEDDRPVPVPKAVKLEAHCKEDRTTGKLEATIPNLPGR